jgi:signal transduction histidine kinase
VAQLEPLYPSGNCRTVRQFIGSRLGPACPQSFLFGHARDRGGGTFFWTLCAIDPKPARLNTPEITGLFKLFAELIAYHFDALQRVTLSEATLRGEQEIAELREQFIAVMGRDLRNPLSAISAGSDLLI